LDCRLTVGKAKLPTMYTGTFAVCLSAGLLVSCIAVAQQAVPLQSAAANSEFPSGAFPATDALSAGSGYWCSSGNHALGERVSWTGIASTRQITQGVSINWVYSPGEFRILTSSDGGNYEEAAGWRTATRPEESYRETIMFDSPRRVKSLIVVMRSPKAGGFFGIIDISLVVRPGPSMLVSSASAEAEELCLVADGSGVAFRSCLGAIAVGSGAEVFSLSHSSQLVSAITGECLALARGRLEMQDCEQAAEAGDGRSTFALTDSAHVQTKTGYCLLATTAGASVAPCSDGGGSEVAMVSVPELDLTAAAHVKDAAALLRAAAARQSTLLGELKRGLQACEGMLQQNTSRMQSETAALAARTRSVHKVTQDPSEEASSKIDQAVGVDLVAVKALISESKATLAST